MKKKIVLISLLVTLFFVLLFICSKIVEGQKNVNNQKEIYTGIGWRDNKSQYSGSELSFSFSNSKSISFEFNTLSKADQGVQIYIDKDVYFMSSPNLHAQKLTINVDKNQPHVVTVRHVCSYIIHPCEITVKGIYVDWGAKFTHYQARTKSLSVLGDSISTLYGKDNYTQILSDSLGYELHNASINGSTLSKISGVSNGINRYKKDLLDYKSNAIIIFLGTNDVSHNVPLETFEKDYSKIVSDIKEHQSNSKIFLAGILKRNDIDDNLIQSYNAVIKKISENNDVNFVDTINWLEQSDLTDGIHPSIGSQKKISDNFYHVLSPILK